MGAFSTTNFSLAMTLATLGVPWANDECPEWREITADELEQNGFKTIEEAERAGFIGKIAYAFGDHPDRRDIIEAFNKAHRTESAGLKIPDSFKLKGANKVEHEKAVKAIAMAFAFGFRNRKKFADRQKKVHSRLRINKGEGNFAIIDRRSDTATKERFSA